MSALVGISDAGDGRLSDSELLENLTLLLVAGFETTTNLLGNGLQIILQDPPAGEAVRDGSVPVAAFIEEVLRYDSPVQLTSRRRADPVEVGGVKVAAEDEVITLLGAGNRGPRRFADPDRLDRRARRAGRSASARARISASARRSPGWRPRRLSRSCCPASRRWPRPPIRIAGRALSCAASRRSR
jgi:cytochrome P450